MRMHALKTNRTKNSSRQTAAREFDAILESKVFNALCEPVRVEIIRVLTLVGRADIAAIAARMPQDRSVISRHLAQLHQAGFLRREKVGRNVFFELDGPAVVQKLEDIVGRFRALAPLCCPSK